MLFLSQYVYKSVFMRLAVFLFDAIGWVLFTPVRLMKSPLVTKPKMRILCIRLDHIGDLLLTRPALLMLKKRFPGSKIDLLVDESVVEMMRNEGFEKVIGFKCSWFSRHRWPWWSQFKSAVSLVKQLREERYDVSIDFRGDLRHNMIMLFSGIPHRFGRSITGGAFLLEQFDKRDEVRHQVEQNVRLLRHLGVEGQLENKPFAHPVSQLEVFRERLERKCSVREESFKLVVHMEAGDPEKQWGDQNYRDVIDSILKNGETQVFLIGKAVKPLLVQSDNVIDLRGETTLTDLISLFSICDAYLGNDSGPGHLAAAQGLECFIIFSSLNDPEIWKPWTKALHLFVHNVQSGSPVKVEQLLPELTRCIQENRRSIA